MTTREFQFPDYGEGGGYMGRKRLRRAFRLLTLSAVLFLASMYYCEYFLRLDQTERLYLSALTQDPGPARAFLRQAVLLERKESNAETRRSPKYLQALAEREMMAERDNAGTINELALEAYQQAYDIDPGNTQLAIRYACALAACGRYPEAAACLEKAGSADQDNALPTYLLAAMKPWLSAEPTEGLRESLVLVARANASGDRVVLPAPLWSSDLPETGMWYAVLQSQVTAECMRPLREYVDFALRRARQDIEKDMAQHWDSWLERLQRMGDVIAQGAILTGESGSRGGAGQALAGLRIEREAMAVQADLLLRQRGEIPTTLSERRGQVESAITRLTEYEKAWPGRIARDASLHMLPLRQSYQGLFVLLLACVFSSIAARFARAGKIGLSVPHGRILGGVMGGGSLLLFAMLWLPVLAPAQYGPIYITASILGWRFVIAALLVFGILYPFHLLPAPRVVCEQLRDDPAYADCLAAARQRRRQAAFTVMRRYYGVCLGAAIMTICFWAISFRFFSGLYPWQIKLLVDGLLSEEAAQVREALSILAR